MEQYLNVLKDSLIKKERILLNLLDKSEEQADVVKQNEVDWDYFTKLVDEKGELVEELLKLDEGFDLLYQRIKENLENNKENYKDMIKEIQELIKSVTQKSADLQALEIRNKRLIEGTFANTRNEIKKSKLSQSAAIQYYNKMNRINTIDPQLMDKNC